MYTGTARVPTMPPSGPHSAIQVEVTTLPFIPGATVRRYLGLINLHFIKESWTVNEGGGLGQVFHLFLSEVMAQARAAVSALGGNALLSFIITPSENGGRVYRNQVAHLLL